VRLRDILERKLVEAEVAPQERDFFLSRVADVQPQPVLTVGQKLREPIDANVDRHACAASVEHEPYRSHSLLPGAPYFMGE
jgi:hypothetical protein